jgi:hypothetical protein
VSSDFAAVHAIVDQRLEKLNALRKLHQVQLLQERPIARGKETYFRGIIICV